MKMLFYAISLGPIIPTFSMARKPRQLWHASYMFSYLMRCIYDQIEVFQKSLSIISPARPAHTSESKIPVGLYPDRIYIKAESPSAEKDVLNALKNAKELFRKSLNLPDDSRVMDYFNIMTTQCEAESYSAGIKTLNERLDIMELFNHARNGSGANEIAVRNLMKGSPKEGLSQTKKYATSKLFEIASGDNQFEVQELRDIANVQYREEKNVNPLAEDLSHHRYICVVQADGDQVGRTVSHKRLKDDQLMHISQALSNFGEKAAEKIERFGGMPIYAGGDDLLFIAPVVGVERDAEGKYVGKKTILELLSEINDESFQDVKNAINATKLTDDYGVPIEASLSYGVSVTYCKYPLYEALEKARDLLFGVAKKVKEKNAIAWCLRKNSGGEFSFSFSLKDNEFKESFQELVQNTTKDDQISAVAFKIRNNESLLDNILNDDSENQDRMNSFFETVLNDNGNPWFISVKKMAQEIFRVRGGKDLTEHLYAVLRSARFIYGEHILDDVERTT